MSSTPPIVTKDTLWRAGTIGAEHFVLDVRTPAEFREVHIPGSTNIPLGDLPRRAAEVAERAQSRPIALVCRTGRRAESACAELARQGLADLQVLEGGIVSWLDGGLPVTRGAKAISIERQVRIVAGFLVLLGVVLGFLVHPSFYVLAGFIGAGLLVAGITDTCGMALVLAKMPWNRASAAAAE
jgi:rhodanese-related sulfurtransferase